MRNVSDVFVEEIKLIFCSVIFFLENPAIYEIMWEISLLSGEGHR